MNVPLSDEEKSFHQWIDNNINFVNQNKNIIHLMKRIYMDGFVAGWTHKLKYSSEESLQK